MKTHLGRRAFSPMELHQIFNAYIYSDDKAFKEQPKHWHFWLPLLAYYTGAFSDEIAHLTPANVVFIKGVPCFELDHSNKLQSRILPIHPAIINAGFNEYLALIKSEKYSRLLHDLPAKSGRYSEKARIWFSGEGERAGYLQKCQIPTVDNQGRKAALSSFRLNFEQQLRIAAIQSNNKPAFSYLMGYKEYQSDTRPDVQILSSLIGQIRSINLKLHWHRFLQRH